ncbi:hypothetical protein FUAX_10840 [Fulvitalea axinellae]|uniref:Uncharacterized protein n=1 Tax=Fulvitalea axinellae TaxID=1182444 RepID=A0AAU9CL32_9BACT|nr:hypothetical protein FUAX_10840 [Fulvitalea axinellae]
MKKLFASLLKPFQSRYSVVFRMYHVIPGQPIKVKKKVQEFEKGDKEAAFAYFQKTVKATGASKIVPVEIELLKGRRVSKRKQFGPVGDIKKLELVA